MSGLGFAIGLAWDITVWFFIASVIAAPFVALVRKARARGKRLFVDEPMARVRALKSNTSHQYEQDAL